MMFSAVIPGQAIPQGSKKYVGRGVMVEANKKLPAWRRAADTVLTAARVEQGLTEPIDAPVRVDATFYMPPPKKPRFWAPATQSTGDADKLARALGDALERNQILVNDSRIVDWTIRTRYTPDELDPRTTVTVTSLDKKHT